VLYGVQNWDLLAIAPLVAGLLAFERGNDRAAGALVGVGACAKLFPGAALLPLAAIRLRAGDRRAATRFLASAAVTTFALNAPVFALNQRGWFAPFRFQSARPDTWATPWFYVFRLPEVDDVVNRHSGSAATLLSVLLLAAGVAFVTWMCWRRPIGAYEAAAASTAVFLLAGKIFSPTYDLWLVPFFVLLPLSRARWVTFCAVDLAIYVTTYGMLHGVVPRSAIALLATFVFARIAVIVMLLVRALDAPAQAPSSSLGVIAR
jgi:uncharacterized membrane protein